MGDERPVRDATTETTKRGDNSQPKKMKNMRCNEPGVSYVIIVCRRFACGRLKFWNEGCFGQEDVMVGVGLGAYDCECVMGTGGRDERPDEDGAGPCAGGVTGRVGHLEEERGNC